jgi:hypothetical protein
MDLREVGWVAWTGSIWLRIEQVAGFCEYGDEPAGSIKCGVFLKSLRTFSFSGRTLLHGISKQAIM